MIFSVIFIVNYVVYKKFIKYVPDAHEKIIGISVMTICFIVNFALSLFAPKFYDKIGKIFNPIFLLLCLTFVITELFLMLKKEK